MTAQEVEQEIERTREHLGETIDALAGRADVKARARARADRVRESKVLQRRWPLAAAVGVLIAGSVIIWRRKRA